MDGIDAEALARMRRKVPEWAGVDGMRYPTRLSMEQCSSSATAMYKAELASRIYRDNASRQRGEERGTTASAADGPVIADMTGGLGVDCWAFCGISEHVHHNEMNEELSAVVRANFSALGIENASFSCIEAAPGKVAEIIAAAGGKADIIFLDPARRSESGRKVFLLEDCSPDIISLKDELLSMAPDVLVKLSPMADISMVCRRLGPEVREVHVVEAEGECKELLVWMQRSWDKGYSIIFKDLRFTPEEEAASSPALLNGEDCLKAGDCLFEPSPALLKSGGFNLICSFLNLAKLGRFTHLYTAAHPEGHLMEYGKLFRIKEVHPFDGRTIKALGKSFPRCEITSRNLPVSSDELRKKMGVRSGGDVHIFACTVDFLSSRPRRVLLVTDVCR